MKEKKHEVFIEPLTPTPSLILLCRKLMLSQHVMPHRPGSPPATKLLADSFAMESP